MKDMTQHPLAGYVVRLAGLSVALAFLTLFLMLVVPMEYLSANIPDYILMFFVVTFLCYLFMYYSPSKTKISFDKALMITKIFKLFIYILAVVIVLVCKIEQNAKFVIAYLILYLCYNIFEAITIRKLIKKDK